MNLSKAQQRSLFKVCAFLSFALIIPSLLNGELDSIFGPLAVAFGCLSYGSAKDAHLFPINAEDAAKTALSAEQRAFGLIGLSCAVFAGVIWYIDGFQSFF